MCVCAILRAIVHLMEREREREKERERERERKNVSELRENQCVSACVQGDQMARLFAHCLAIYNNVILHNSIKNCQSRLKISPNTNWAPKIS